MTEPPVKWERGTFGGGAVCVTTGRGALDCQLWMPSSRPPEKSAAMRHTTGTVVTVGFVAFIVHPSRFAVLPSCGTSITR
jgi:hypothetical protein